MAPQEIDKFLESNNQALLNTSTYIGSGILDFDADFEEALRTPQSITKNISIVKLPSKIMIALGADDVNEHVRANNELQSGSFPNIGEVFIEFKLDIKDLQEDFQVQNAKI